MIATGIRMTADELLGLPDNGKRYELIAGELHEMAPAGGEHGFISGRTVRRLSAFLDQHPEVGGEVFIAEPGYRLARDPDTVRAPDIAYVIESRLEEAWGPGYANMAPDLIVEVVSPSDTAGEVQRKVDEWLAAGSTLVWVLYPATRSVMVYRADGPVSLLHADDTLHGEPVLPGFSCRVGDLFEKGRRSRS
jgi:Uma2 family endonuclease